MVKTENQEIPAKKIALIFVIASKKLSKQKKIKADIWGFFVGFLEEFKNIFLRFPDL